MALSQRHTPPTTLTFSPMGGGSTPARQRRAATREELSANKRAAPTRRPRPPPRPRPNGWPRPRPQARSLHSSCSRGSARGSGAVEAWIGALSRREPGARHHHHHHHGGGRARHNPGTVVNSARRTIGGERLARLRRADYLTARRASGTPGRRKARHQWHPQQRHPRRRQRGGGRGGVQPSRCRVSHSIGNY